MCAFAPTPFQFRAAERKSFYAMARGGFQPRKRLFDGGQPRKLMAKMLLEGLFFDLDKHKNRVSR